MSTEKTPSTSPEALFERAHECLENAEMQKGLAEKQYFIADQLTINANDLSNLGHALEAVAIEKKGSAPMDALGNAPPRPRIEDRPALDQLQFLRTTNP